MLLMPIQPQSLATIGIPNKPLTPAGSITAVTPTMTIVSVTPIDPSIPKSPDRRFIQAVIKCDRVVTHFIVSVCKKAPYIFRSIYDWATNENARDQYTKELHERLIGIHPDVVGDEYQTDKINSKEHTHILIELLRNGANVNQQLCYAKYNSWGDRLHDSATLPHAFHRKISDWEAEDTHRFRYVLKRYETLNKIWPMNIATILDNREFAEALIKHKSEVNMLMFGDYSPLYAAVKNNNAKLAELLLIHGADVNGVGKRSSNAPLHMAIINNNFAIVKLLLSFGADTTLRSLRQSKTPLAYAISKKNIEIINYLVRMTGDDEDRDWETVKNRTSSLHLAIKYDCKSLVEYLINAGANINAARFTKYPLHLALERGLTEIAHMLIDHGANVNVVDSNGHSPLNYAAEYLDKCKSLRSENRKKNPLPESLLYYNPDGIPSEYPNVKEYTTPDYNSFEVQTVMIAYILRVGASPESILHSEKFNETLNILYRKRIWNRIAIELLRHPEDATNFNILYRLQNLCRRVIRRSLKHHSSVDVAVDCLKIPVGSYQDKQLLDTPKKIKDFLKFKTN